MFFSIISLLLWREIIYRKRRIHKPEFKAKVALTTLQGDLIMTELVKKFDVHPNQISDWKKQVLGGASDVFGDGLIDDIKCPAMPFSEAAAQL